jgi:hypothetical protein
MDAIAPEKTNKMGCLSILGLMLLTIILSVGSAFWLIKTQLFPAPFSPVKLNTNEENTLQRKLKDVGLDKVIASSKQSASLKQQEQDSINLEPEVYTENPTKRNISLTEKELNAILANNTNLAQRLVIDLSEGLASAKLLVHLDPDLPFFGGKTLKISAGTEISFQRNQPVIVLKGVSVWGVPIPNAWLGGLKNIDLISEFGQQDGFWKSFADGIEDIRITHKELHIRLKE